MNIEIKILNKEFYCEQNLPKYSTLESAGLDLVCTKDITIYPGAVKTIPTGLAIWIGASNKRFHCIYETISELENLGIAGVILPRSGWGTKGLILANTMGIIDSDYQGEIIVQAWNRCNDNTLFNKIKLKAGERFAQLIFVPIVKAKWELVEEFSDFTMRNTGGFGSTGK